MPEGRRRIQDHVAGSEAATDYFGQPQNLQAKLYFALDHSRIFPFSPYLCGAEKFLTYGHHEESDHIINIIVNDYEH